MYKKKRGWKMNEEVIEERKRAEKGEREGRRE